MAWNALQAASAARWTDGASRSAKQSELVWCVGGGGLLLLLMHRLRLYLGVPRARARALPPTYLPEPYLGYVLASMSDTHAHSRSHVACSSTRLIIVVNDHDWLERHVIGQEIAEGKEPAIMESPDSRVSGENQNSLHLMKRARSPLHVPIIRLRIS